MPLDAAAAKAPVAPAAHKPDSQPPSRLQVPSTVQTQLGGIFYLLNLAVFLDPTICQYVTPATADASDSSHR